MKIKEFCIAQKFLMFCICLFSINFYGQQDLSAMTKEFDEIVGEENRSLNNGTFHTNTYRVINEKTRYFNNKFLEGNLTYDGRDYFDVPLKYDLLEDVLVLQPYSASGTIGVNLINQKLDSFSINNRNFVNLGKLVTQSKISGNYEKIAYNPNLVLYIKHIKKSRVKKDRSLAYYEFEDDNNYLVFYDGEYHQISSRGSAGRVFPNFKSEIREFYRINKNLERTNEITFYQNLISYINNLQKK